MATLASSFPQRSFTAAVIVPAKPPLSVTFTQLNDEVASFQKKLAALGIVHGSAVSIALPNSYEFIVRQLKFESLTAKTNVDSSRFLFWPLRGSEGMCEPAAKSTTKSDQFP